MKVASILKSKGSRVVTMRPDSSITSVIQRMKLERIGAIVISADGERIDGIVSERDIVYGLADQHGPGLRSGADDQARRNALGDRPRSTGLAGRPWHQMNLTRETTAQVGTVCGY